VPRGPHDLGGVRDADVSGPIDRSQHNFQWWEKQIDSLLTLLSRKKLFNVHMFRAMIESMEPTVYASTSYFEKWAFSITKCMLYERVFTQLELDTKLGLDNEDEKEVFSPGDQVRVKYENYSTRWRKPHLRTPGYIFGKIGVIERLCGHFTNPETSAFGGSNAKKPLYRVRFSQKEVWPSYPGSHHDTIDIEITQNWLQPATELQPETTHTNLPHTQQHSHASHHHHDSDDHKHEERTQVEQKALETEGPETPFQYLAKKLVELLIEKDVVSPTDMRQHIEKMDNLDKNPCGARLVANAWFDDNWCKEFLSNPQVAAQKINMKVDSIVVVVKNTDEFHNVVVCTLCSCYPKDLLGRPPDWYKSRSYRARMVYQPREVLKEFGTIIPENVQVRVHDSTADMRYLVIPKRPQGTEGWTVEELEKIVTRDSMIGVSVIETQKSHK